MIRPLLAALLLPAPALAHSHWADLDGDGFMEPDEFDIGEVTFADADLDGDGRISDAEYRAIALIIASEEDVSVPEPSVGDADPGVDPNPDPKLIEVD
jgi:hypothetical protein